MNESLLRGFCESRHRLLIVAIVTTVVGLVVLVPLVDDYFAKRESRRTLVEELGRARETERTLPAFEQRVMRLEGDVAQLEARTVGDGSVSQFRSDLLELVRKAGCQMRRLEVGDSSHRPWLAEDDPLQPTAPVPTAQKTPFELERRSLNLSVDGEMTNIHAFLEQLEQEKTIAYPRRVQLRAAGGRGALATLELELWLFALRR